jgi:glycosyltransferase involved in cell wall biosynthesis
MESTTTSYILLTAARNEETYIAKTIESVIGQTVLPKCWVIISDSSTDRTDDIVREYAERHPFIRFVRREKKSERDFSSRTIALQEGFRLFDGMEYAFFCTLDAGVSFDSIYFQTILEKFRANPKLGIAGGVILEYYKGRPRTRIASRESVTGAVQCVRRECMQADYNVSTSKDGGQDSIIEVRAKMSGWEVQSFPELLIHHYRPTGLAEGALKSKYHYGVNDYRLGNPVVFEFLKCCHRMFEFPYVVSGCVIFLGYLSAFFKKPPRLLSDDEIAFVKTMQMRKITRVFRRLLRNPQQLPVV